MRYALFFSYLVLASIVSSMPANASSTFHDCLSKAIKPSDVVATHSPGTAPNGEASKVTVEQTLDQLESRCENGRLVDGASKEIYFYKLIGCWGNPPEGYLEILKKQSAELAILRERYTVIEMTCNPTGIPIP